MKLYCNTYCILINSYSELELIRLQLLVVYKREREGERESEMDW